MMFVLAVLGVKMSYGIWQCYKRDCLTLSCPYGCMRLLAYIDWSCVFGGCLLLDYSNTKSICEEIWWGCCCPFRVGVIMAPLCILGLACDIFWHTCTCCCEIQSSSHDRLNGVAFGSEQITSCAKCAYIFCCTFVGSRFNATTRMCNRQEEYCKCLKPNQEMNRDAPVGNPPVPIPIPLPALPSVHVVPMFDNPPIPVRLAPAIINLGEIKHAQSAEETPPTCLICTVNKPNVLNTGCSCGALFCLDCLTKVMQTNDPKCSLCRRPIKSWFVTK